MKILENTILEDILSIEEFNNYSHLIFPFDYVYDTSIKLNQINRLMPWHTHINTNTSIEVLNYMKNNTDTVFYDIYTRKEKKANPSLNNTGLFHFKGKEDAPFAIINAGGGFVYVGSIHESFPHALELSKKGLNGFALVYRPEVNAALRDLSRATEFIFDNKKDLGVSTEDYSVWGGSAGARMVAYLGTYGSNYFGSHITQRPQTVIMQYTGHSEVGPDEPNTYAIMGDRDMIASPRTMQSRINKIKKQGAKAEFHLCPNLQHGFGLGLGTSAEGWINDAVKFWQEK